MPLGADINAGFLRLKAAVAGTIASGVLIVTQSQMIVTSETGTSDNLDTLTIDTSLIMPAGYTEMIVLYAAAGHTITITDAAGNVLTNSGGNFSMTDVKAAILSRRDGSSNWILSNG